ncbi:MAG: hypothetical protein RMJ56_09960 [Gemmataceae bacterium]|nr:hypothetical protein [Gemmata sp.]MDW8197914.1 hypothetical protein [Gemmataceae bacterium]
MTRTPRFRLSIVLAGVAAVGCVDRKFVIESNVPNAQISIDNKPIGAAPAYAPFEYYGYYTFTAVHPDYETVVLRQRIAAPWYAYPPLDFLAEVVWPFPIRDTRRIYIEMVPAAKPRTDDILSAAEQLRRRGQTLPPAERPAAPRPPRQPSAPGPSPAPLPPPTPLPNSAPPQGVIPNVLPD